MKEYITVALDAMGGDYAPLETVKGGVDAVNTSDEVKVLLVGDEAKIQAELSKYTYDNYLNKAKHIIEYSKKQRLKRKKNSRRNSYKTPPTREYITGAEGEQ